MLKKIKICFITTGLETGGAEMMLFKLLSGIDRARFEPSVISLRDKGTLGKQIEDLGISVYTLNMGKISGLLSLSSLIRLVKDLSPDILQGWMYHGDLAAQVINTFLPNKVPVAWSIHNSLQSLKAERMITQKVIKLNAYFSGSANKIIYVANKVKSEHEEFGFRDREGIVIPNGFDTDLFRPLQGAREELCRELEISPDSFLIGLIGRFHPVKDHHNFLQAAEKAIKEYKDVYCILAGREVNSNNFTLMQQINSLRISSQVKLLDERKDIPRILSSLDIACSSSYSEAFPLVLGEAMACGTPCVATDVGDSAWILDDTGFVVPPRNPEALANGFEKAINLGSQARRELGISARNRIIENFSLTSVIARYETVYESMLVEKYS